MVIRRLLVAAAVTGGALVTVIPTAHADYCSDGPLVTTDSGVQACAESGTFDGTVTADSSGYVVADGSDTNTIPPSDGYVGVDQTGPVACASGDYSPNQGDPVVGGTEQCDPQAPQY